LGEFIEGSAICVDVADLKVSIALTVFLPVRTTAGRGYLVRAYR
jgi:hypothetical protein